MRPAIALTIVLSLSAASTAIAKPKRKTAPPAAAPIAAPTVALVRGPDGWRADLAFDGLLSGWALPRTRGGQGSLLILIGQKREDVDADAASCGVRDTAAARRRDARLYRWRSEIPDRLELVGSGLPEGSLDTADLDGDGNDELLLLREGRIDVLTVVPGGQAETKVLVEDDLLGTACCGPRASWDPSQAPGMPLRVTLLGALRTYRRSPDGTSALSSEIAIPVRVSAQGDRMRVESPSIHAIGRAVSGRTVFATEPEPLGSRRLRTMLVDPDGPAESQVVESWSNFPQAERVVDSAFFILDGAPVLIVTTTSADKLSLLGEKALRVFPLGGDRTRAGSNPVFAATTGINLWQRAVPAVVDLDRDGRGDLVLSYWKGLQNSIAALEVYRGDAQSGFSKSHSMSFDVDDGDKGFMEFGTDADGDGRPDLILLANHEMRVYPGEPPNHAVDKPVANSPSRRIALPADLPRADRSSIVLGLDGIGISRTPRGLGTPRFLDLDGDARADVVFAGNGDAGGRFVLIFVRGSPAVAPSHTLTGE